MLIEAFIRHLFLECMVELYSRGVTLPGSAYNSLGHVNEKQISTLFVSISRVNETLELGVAYAATYKMEFTSFAESLFLDITKNLLLTRRW